MLGHAVNFVIESTSIVMHMQPKFTLDGLFEFSTTMPCRPNISNPAYLSTQFYDMIELTDRTDNCNTGVNKAKPHIEMGSNKTTTKTFKRWISCLKYQTTKKEREMRKG